MSLNYVIAKERVGKPSRIRREGFVPGVIYGKSMEKPISVKFEMGKLRSALNSSAGNAIIKVKVGNDIKQCIVKDLQRDIRTGVINHIDFQAAAADDIVKLKVPISYSGREWLENKGLILETLVNELEVTGKPNDIPASIDINLEGSTFGDKITVSDIKVNSGIDIINDMEDMVAVITGAKKAEPVATEEIS